MTNWQRVIARGTGNRWQHVPTEERAELCHLRQQCATLAGELQQAREQCAMLAARLAALELDNASLREGISNYMQILDEQCKRRVQR